MTNQTQNKRDSFIFYRSFFMATKCLKNDEKAQLFDAICNYALDGETINLDGTASGMFELVKPQLDANRKRFENGCKKKQNRSKTEAKPKQKISKTEANVNDNVNYNVNEECKLELNNDNVNNNINKTKKFVKPTIEEIKQYCLERKNNVNPGMFFNYYESNGWKVGKNPMKDWQASIRTWEKNNFNNQSKPSGGLMAQFNDPAIKRVYAYDEDNDN